MLFVLVGLTASCELAIESNHGLFSECTDVNECSAGKCGTDSQCQNYNGGFDCECKVPGHFKVNANGTCKRKFC